MAGEGLERRPTRLHAEDPPTPADESGGVRRWLRRLVPLVAVLAVSVSISRCGPDDGPSNEEPGGCPWW